MKAVRSSLYLCVGIVCVLVSHGSGVIRAAGIPYLLQLLQGVIAAHLNRTFGGGGLLDICMLDFLARNPSSHGAQRGFTAPPQKGQVLSFRRSALAKLLGLHAGKRIDRI